MKAPKKKPFIISRQPRKVPTSNNEFDSENRALLPIARKDPQLDLQNQILASQTVFKNCYNLFKVSPNLLPELLQKYAEDNVNYRDEEFTQQADNFITKIATSKKIPKDIKAKHPLYYILISIAKIFMLNEYEIVVLGCALDHCSWKIEETVYPEEADFLKEFPGNLGNEIDSDCKRLIIFLLVITFSLKQYLNEKGEADKIHAYCESICINFQAIFNRWTRVSFYHKFNYSPLEINRKFRSLCQKETFDPLSTINKDYNMVVDSIMNLTGSYKSKLNTKPLMVPQPAFQPNSIFHNFNLAPVIEAKPLFADLPSLPALSFERGNSRPPRPLELINIDGYELPPVMDCISRRTSSSNLLGEEFGKNKKIKMNNSTSGFGLFRENSFYKEYPNILGNTPGRNIEPEDFLKDLGNLPMPSLSKRSSNVSQAMPEEMPNLFKFHSNMSWFNKD